VQAAGQFAIGPEHVLVSGSAPLVFAEKYLAEFNQIVDRRVIVVIPLIFIRALGLEPPGSASLDYADLPLYTAISANDPGMSIMHD
jgi:hypothetical protein